MKENLLHHQRVSIAFPFLLSLIIPVCPLCLLLDSYGFRFVSRQAAKYRAQILEATVRLWSRLNSIPWTPQTYSGVGRVLLKKNFELELFGIARLNHRSIRHAPLCVWQTVNNSINWSLLIVFSSILSDWYYCFVEVNARVCIRTYVCILLYKWVWHDMACVCTVHTVVWSTAATQFQ